MNTIVEKNSFIKQTALLINRQIALKKRMIYGGLAVIIGFLLITILLISLSTPENQLYGPLTFSIASILVTYGGYAFSSTMFNELNLSGAATQFLTLPASALEKLTAAWFISFVGYTAVGAVSIFLLSLIVDINLSAVPVMSSMPSLYAYIITQSIFLFGAVYFKANNFLATVVAMMVVVLGFSLIYILLKSFIPNIATIFDSVTVYLSELKQWGNILLTIVVSLIFSGLTYLRLKTRQIA